MTTVTESPLEKLYGMLKQHEISLSRIACKGFRIESDIFGELMSDTRIKSLEIEDALDHKHVHPNEINVPDQPEYVTPGVLVDQRKAFCGAYDKAIENTQIASEDLSLLTRHRKSFDGTGRENLELLSMAVMGGQ